eukprot:TRINITY_DN13050_c0_g1_i1.p1 TRINITY_DN13050_c0_g1~~TRINITY_DN13050_c0_g1_i1.p1  ORF type:complete len:423 (-),score=26.59 TRINITY_DN13050_c0_g1_i1:13-1281(-)
MSSADPPDNEHVLHCVERLSDASGSSELHVALLLELLSACYSAGFSRVEPPPLDSIDDFDASGDPLFDADFGRAALLSLVSKEHDGLAQSTIAAAQFCTLSPRSQLSVMDNTATILNSSEFQHQRLLALRSRHDRSCGKNDFGSQDTDFGVIDALYDVSVSQLAPVLSKLGFPTSPLGFNSFLGALRVAGFGDRMTHLVTRIWHAAETLEPLFFSRRGHARRDTLVIAFSSLGCGVIRPEWRSTLALDNNDFDVAHCFDAGCSWYCTDPYTGMWDGGVQWEHMIEHASKPYARVCLLGDSMGGSAALRFARFATDVVIAFTPQVDVSNCPADCRPDFSPKCQEDLRERILAETAECTASVIVHVGRDPYDLAQASMLPESVKVVNHDVDGHLVSLQLKQDGVLRDIVLADLRAGRFAVTEMQ